MERKYMNQKNENNLLNSINQDEIDRQIYQKNMILKRYAVNCINWGIGYIFLFVLFVISLVVLIVLSCLIVNEINKGSISSIPDGFWGFLTYIIFDFIFLEIISFVLLSQSKKLKKEYPKKIKKLPNLYLVGLFLIFPSFVGTILIIPICKKIGKEINKELSSKNFV